MIEAAKLEADIYPAGPRGLSAYEIYKKEGGQLSEDEWLKSLNGLTPTIGENGNWFLGTVDTGLPSRGPKGDTGSIKFIVVTELPTENIDETAIYMKPVKKPNGKNNFEELIYVNGKWEDLGTPNVEVDLSNYYTKKESDKNLNDTISENMPLFINAPKYADFVGEKTTEIFRKWYNNYKNGKYIPIMLYTHSRTDWKYVYCFLTGIHDNGTSRLYLYFANMKVNSSNEIIPSTISYAPTYIVYSGTPDKSFVSINADNDNGSLPFTQITNITNSTISNYTLTKANTTAYTPTKDYHPSTKKYVDDTISVKGGDKLHDYNIYTITLDNYNLKGTFPTITDTATLAKFDEILTDIYKKRIASNATHDNAFLIVYSSSDTFIFRISIIGSSYCNLYGTYVEQPIDHNGYTCSYTFFITGTLDTTAQTFKTTKVKFDNNSRRVLLTNNTLSYNPTSNYNPSTKLYTDKTHYENMTGYDATKTQVLKNINGTLTWVDEV